MCTFKKLKIFFFLCFVKSICIFIKFEKCQLLHLFKLYSSDHHSYILDQYWKPLQPISNWYYSLKRVGLQRPSFSNLTNDYVDYGC